ncbi:radial spoke head protein 6 homolog A [Copidosoma floridanum]|uniref:radial spoke head protein 6 homolog A n=1 Tax=Copidosoma floridanum TaxID=29053 RepID=UPI000C6F905A|nr:radial spoke head protein 6 homolog A [Copidosoma floridanum]
MAQSYDANEVPAEETPCVNREIDNAKLYLRKFCPEAGDTLYDHLSEVLGKILVDRPRNPFASFDQYSRKLREDKFRAKDDHLLDLYVPPARIEEARVLVNVFKVKICICRIKETLALNEDDSGAEEEEYSEGARCASPNLLELFYHFELVGIGLPRVEVVLLNLSLRTLIANTRIEDARFWGKILGRSRNYYVVEASLPSDEVERRLRLREEEEQRTGGDVERSEASDSLLEAKLSDEGVEKACTEDSETLKLELPPVPVNTWSPPPKVSPEKLGTGLNAKVYFVCNAPGLDDWVELPQVLPEQIVLARQIVHAFTGELEADIHTFPPFPGCEKNYLRAQIARIGAATQVSPIGYYAPADEEGEEEDGREEDDDEEEEATEGSPLEPNRRYQPLPAKELIEPSNWCHHARPILEQGREVWLEPGKTDDASDRGVEEGEEEEEEEEAEFEEESEALGQEGLVGEVGPALLRPLSEDAEFTATPAWCGRLSSAAVHPDAAAALLRSNVWPGAFAFAADKKFGNVYIGWGHKRSAYNYSPPVMPEVEEQYVPIGCELVEARDPSFEEEEAYRIAHLPREDDDAEEEDEVETEEEDGDTEEEQL